MVKERADRTLWLVFSRWVMFRRSCGKNPMTLSKTMATRRGGILLVGLCLLLFMVQAGYLWRFGIDDAAITYRYAENLADGEGLTWNPGQQPPVEGYSNFSWVLLLAGTRLTGADIEIAAKVLGLIFGAATLVLLWLLGPRVLPTTGMIWLGPLIVALTPGWLLWTVSGLEIPLYGLLVVLTAYALTCREQLRTLLLCIACAGLILTRPEGAVIAGIAAIVPIVVGHKQGKSIIRTYTLLPLCVVVFTSSALLAFRYIYFDAIFPNTVHAKFSWKMPGLTNLQRFLAHSMFFVAAWVVLLRRERGGSMSSDAQYSPRTVQLAILALIAGQLLATAPVRPTMHFFYRHQIAFLPLVVLPTAYAIAWLARGRRWIVAGAFLIVAAWSARGWPGVIERAGIEWSTIGVQRCVVEKLATLPGSPRIALIDAGRIPYWSGLPSIDVWGLCDREIAREGFTPARVLAKQPDVYVMTSDTAAVPDNTGLSVGWKPALTMDRKMVNDSLFMRTFQIWTACVGQVDAKYRRYDYAVFLSRDYIGRNDIIILPGGTIWNPRP